MDISIYASMFECSFVIDNKTTTLTIKEDIYELPFVISVEPRKGCILFDKVSNYVLKQTVENNKVVKNEGSFGLYCIELYEKKFNDAMEEFNKVVSLSSSPLMKDVIIKAFFNIIDISEKSYNKAYNYLHNYMYKGNFRQYCDLE